MYKKLFFLIVFSIVYQSLYSQGFRGYAVTLMNGQQIDGDRRGGYDQFGVYLGAGLSRSLKPKTNIQFEIAYSMKGSRDKSTKFDPNVDSIIRVNYIDFSLYLTYKINAKLLFNLGPYLGYLLDAEFSDGITTTSNLQLWFKTDLGAFAGVEYLLNDRFSVQYRFAHSIIPASKLYDPSVFNPLYHNVSSIGIKYFFN